MHNGLLSPINHIILSNNFQVIHFINPTFIIVCMNNHIQLFLFIAAIGVKPIQEVYRKIFWIYFFVRNVFMVYNVINFNRRNIRKRIIYYHYSYSCNTNYTIYEYSNSFEKTYEVSLLFVAVGLKASLSFLDTAPVQGFV